MQFDLGSHGNFDKNRFRELFAGVYEHSPWLADAVFESMVESPIVESSKGKNGHCAALIQRFEQAFLSSTKAQQLEVLRAHPELACQRAVSVNLTVASQREQSGSGLDQCSEKELKQFLEYNYKYMNKNNFPFIVAVKGLTRSDILQLFEKRLANDSDTEFKIALQQVNRIARFRIETILHA